MVEKASYSSERSLKELEAFQVGPLGEQQGREWSYISKGAITGIMLSRDHSAVVSYVFQGVDENGNVEYSDTFGYHYKDVHKVMLDWPEEYFTSLSGTYYLGAAAYYFSSLCFHTNRKKYGPFGYVSGTPFEFAMEGRVIVGFYGGVLIEQKWTCGTLGVYVKHSTDMLGSNSSRVQVVKPKDKVGFKQENCIKVGPWGWSRSTTEKQWSYMLKGGAITEIKIGYNGDFIKSISFKSSDKRGEVKHSRKSKTNDEKHEVILLNWSEEYMVSISGTLRTPIHDIESLCFYTNRTIYGPFGIMKGPNPFRFYMKGGIIVGFHGRVGDYFDALGVYITPFSELFSFSSQGQIENTSVKAGLFGGEGGKEWSYKPNGAITEITISHGWVIDSLSFKSVDQTGKCEDSGRFGGEGGVSSLIIIDWPREYLTSISGTHNTFIKKQHVIESLCFHTNKKKYGPFGCIQGSPFDLPLKYQAIVGFHGRASNYVDAIGVYQKGPSS
ncbi:hypothetical protein Ddye_012742 [Dipteronia dyeriana]|uniref:Jacalin-type lectin domain-containing protein n=1 Tax=Dipteronia dyeriana TaxID=168575 RepID=A0AAE0CIY6_9ROSI|nr:hypothetical protein Ddye_012742 [Dipteronia dyeriana]